MGHIQTLSEFLNFLLRRRWLILGCGLLAAVLAAVLALRSAPSYRAFTSIEVQSPQVSVPDGPATGSATSGTPQALQAIRHRLTTRDNLAAVIARHGLYADMPPSVSTETKVGLLGRAITFDTVEIAGDPAYGQPSQLSAIIISVEFDDGENAARIANDLAQGVLDLSSATQIRRASETFDFHDERQRQVAQALQAQESKIAQYRIEHANALPPATTEIRIERGTLEGDIRGLEQQMIVLREEQRQLGAREVQRPMDRQRIREIDDSVQVLTEQATALGARRALLSQALDGVPEVERGLADLERDLRQLQMNFEAADRDRNAAASNLTLAERQQGERFALLDRALVPEHPQGRGRKSKVILGFVGGLVGGLILAFLLDLLRPVVRSGAQMERELGLRPILSIPELPLTKRRKGFGWFV